jgi:ubiquinol-cytochrome c reductase cytochrome b subunit
MDGHDGRGRQVWEFDEETQARRIAEATAPDLGNLGSREWMRAIITNFEQHFAPLRNAEWFGKEEGIEPAESEMADWSGDRHALQSDENASDLAALIEFLMAERKSETIEVDDRLVERGRELATQGNWASSIEVACTECHETIGEEFDASFEGGSGYPDLAGYLSYEWLVDFLKDPGSPQYYGDKNQMPAFHDTLTTEELDLLVRWLLGSTTTAGIPK